ncbi:PLDc N-terminal domain-containing protein [Hamadaea sp. NPDC050747]|uniref:PLDc N-terminal domain-containing protein n=1 Tax=Hamadaea sp. NPDC050747 TaxID=3155789 RepID=UPI0033EB4C1F
MNLAATDADLPLAALAPLVLLGLAFVVYCLYDLARNEVRYLPKWAWAAICVISIPIGGIVYLLVGRSPR